MFLTRNEFVNIVSDERYPGYVRVDWRGALDLERISKGYAYRKDLFEAKKLLPRTECRKIQKKTLDTCNTPNSNLECVFKGPAQKTYLRSKSSMVGHTDEIFTSDNVIALRCVSFSPEALEWIVRERHYGWPDERTISIIVRNGCHIVPTSHNDCEEDEFQWRISFSTAEVVLMKALTPGQQHIYNMLRYFAKKELTRPEWSNSKNCVSMYIIKTLMLWHCERFLN